MSRLICLVSCVLLTACGFEKSGHVTRLSGIFTHKEKEYYVLIYDKRTDRYKYGYCRGAVTIETFADCDDFVEKQPFGDKKDFVHEIIERLQKDYLSLPADLGFHVARGSQAYLSGDVTRLKAKISELTVKVESLETKIAFLISNKFDTSELSAARKLLLAELEEANNQLAGIDPSVESLTTLIDGFIDLVTKESMVAHTMLDVPGHKVIFNLLTNADPANRAIPTYFDAKAGRLWREVYDRAGWTETRAAQSSSCESILGDAWHTPSYNQVVTAMLFRISITKGSNQGQALDPRSYLLDWIAPERRGEQLKLICTADLSSVWPEGDIDFDGVKNKEDSCHAGWSASDNTELEDCQQSEQNQLVNYRYERAEDPFPTKDYFSAFEDVKKSDFSKGITSSNVYEVMPKVAPRNLDQARLFCQTVGAELAKVDHVDNAVWINKGFALVSSKQSHFDVFHRDLEQSPIYSNERMPGYKLAIVWKDRAHLTLRAYDPGGKPSFFLVDAALAEEVSVPVAVWCQSGYALDTSDIDFDTVPNSQDLCLSKLDDPTPVDEQGCSASDLKIDLNAFAFELSSPPADEQQDNPAEVDDAMPLSAPTEAYFTEAPAPPKLSAQQLRCLEDAERIREESWSGICLNTSSKRCYKVRAGVILYEEQRVNCLE